MGHIIEAPPGDDIGPLLNRISLAQYAAAVAFVALRFVTRGCLVKKFGLDDLFIAVAVMLGGVQTLTIIMQVEHGRGRHAMQLHLDDFNEMLKYMWLNMLTYFVANWAVKMSILALYYRIGSGRRGLPWIVQAPAVWATAGLMTAFTVASFLAQMLACIPISRAWDVTQQPQGCIDGETFMQVSAAINVGMDVVLLLFPLPLLPLLKFNRKQRTALALIFSVGLVPVIASTMRLCEIAMSGNPVSDGMPWRMADSSWTWSWVPVWSQIEVDIGIVVASLPSLHPLVKHVWKGFSTNRSMTPSQLPDFPEYHESWNSQDPSSVKDADMEKALKSNEMTFYDEVSDAEDEIDLAKRAEARITVESRATRTDRLKRWWKI